jgi:hypothetical protein
VYESWRNPHDNGAIYSALVPAVSVKDALSDVSWDLRIGDGGPACTVTYGNDGEDVINYHRMGDRGGIEPLVLVRDFHGVRPGYTELLEEFRLFHQLYYDPRTSRLLKFDDAGQEHEVVRVEEKRVMVHARELRQFLAVKDASLILQIDSISHSTLPLASIPENERSQAFLGSDCTWRFAASDSGIFRYEECKSFSRLLGKQVVTGVPKNESGFWPYDDREEDEYPEFIIGADSNGDIVHFTCNPDKLDNYFGANPSAPRYLTPVYFRREVLQRYYGNPTLYSVEDGALRCGGLWMLYLDNHLNDVVSVYLGDLGRDLPNSERAYWLPFNIQADAGMSAPKIKRDFQAEFADPEHPDLLFKYRLAQFNQAWAKKYGWSFFHALAPGDQHLLKTLREPLNDDQSEFDSQVLTLTKILVDSLNERELASISTSLPSDTKGISKLELYLTHHKMPTVEHAIGFLRSLQSLRSTGVGHRKGGNYAKSAATFRVEELGRRVAFRSMLALAREHVLERIGDYMLDTGWR